MSLAIDPGVQLEPSLLHLPGRPDRRRRARRQSDGLAPQHGGHRGDPDPDPAHRASRPPPGRHGGCRLLIASNGALIVGTGDAAIGTNPQDLTSLGGKTLRLNRITGAPWPTNPFISSSNAQPALRAHLRAPQRPGTGAARRTEPCGRPSTDPTATTRSTELSGGHDYGWNPVPGLQRERADDRPQPARHPDAARSGARDPPRSRPRAPPGSRGKQVGRLREHARRRRAQGITRDVHALRLGGRVRRDAHADGAATVRPVAVGQQRCPTAT